MHLRHLRAFVAVAEVLNFSRAAEDLEIAQPAVSQQIRALEEELGVQVFDRIGKRVSVTEAGRVLLPYARQILGLVESAENEVRERGQLKRGRASLGAPPTVSTHVLPARLTQFKQQHPGLEVLLREAGTETLLRQVEEGKLDLAIVATDVLPSAVESVPFMQERYVLAVSVQHPFLGRRQSVRIADLSAEPFILFPEGYRLREVTLEACAQAGFEPKVALDGGAMQSALEFVGAGLGVALVPELALTEVHGIKPLKILDQDLRRFLGLTWLKARSLSPAARALREFMMRLN
ncbi:MAG TPA: LysR substrate-binding domain-containing protein [Anaerolineales bacterium]|nr:LysR substrate-binding domain-containing protein [Anaerolineales bacterium]